MTPFAGISLNVLLDVALKGTVVLAMASLLVFMLRRSSAASRHLVWQLALIAVLALPLLKVVSPVRLPVLPALRSPIAEPVQQREEPQPLVTNTEAEQAQKTEESTTSPDISALVFAPATSSPPATEVTPTQTKTPVLMRVLFWSAVMWAVVAAVLLVRLLAGFLLVRFYALRAYPLYENGWYELKGELTAQMGLQQPVRLLGSPHIATPMTWGVWRPVVMLPSVAEDWNDERRRVVLLHELAHIRRRDSLTHMLAQLTCAVYWFHPLVWKAAARMRAEAERACDDLVLRAGTRASVYADHLLELIRTIGGERTPAVALPMAQRSTFEGRLLAILEPHLDRSAPRPLAVAGVAVVVTLLVLPLAGLTSRSELNALPTVTLDDSRAGDKADRSERRRPDERRETADKTTINTEAAHDIKVSFGLNELIENAGAVDVGDVANVMTAAAHVVQEVSESAVPSLIAALADTDAQVRLAAVQSLGEFDDDRVIRALSNALRNDTDAAVRNMAAWALGNIEDDAGVPALVHAVKNDRDDKVRATAIWALGQIESASAVPALTEILRSSGDAGVRKQVVWALGQIEDESAVPALAAALGDRDESVRNMAVWALGEIESDKAVGPLTDVLRSSNSAMRKQAAWALGQIEDEAAVPALSAVLRDSNVEVRTTAAWALGQIESEAAVPALAQALKDANAGVRKQAAWALGQIEARPAPQALIDALKDSDVGVRAMASWALSQIEDPASAPALRAAMRDANPEVRRSVLRALTQLGDEAAIEALAEMLKDPDPEVRRAAAAALGGRGSWPDPRPDPRPQPRPDPRSEP